MKPEVTFEDDGSAIAVMPGGDCILFTADYNASAENTDSYQVAIPSRDPWEALPVLVGQYEVVPFGSSNRLPLELRALSEENAILPGVLNRKTELLWGQGPALYTTKIVNGVPVREWTSDPAIESWLESFDANAYLLSCIIDYENTGGIFTKFYSTRGAVVGLNNSLKIAKLQQVSPLECFLEWPKNADFNNITGIIVADQAYPNIQNAWRYPVFNPAINAPVSMMYSGKPTYGRRGYSLPSYYGGRYWIKRSSTVPKVLQSLTDNSSFIKWHVKIPYEYWEKAAEKLKMELATKAAIEGREFRWSDSYLDKFKEEKISSLIKTMSGQNNVGKLLQSDYMKDNFGNLLEWKVESIDQKVKEFIEGQNAIAKTADYRTLSAAGLHPALSNIGAEGKADSGSEQLYALKNYVLTSVTIPELVVTKAINAAIKANFPNAGVKLGFYHLAPEKEQDVTASKRVANNV
jgi:hypothetical protein